MKRAETIVDPIFGKLQWDGYFWEGKAKVEALGGNVDLFVDGDDSPGDAQRETFVEFIKNQVSLLQELERALFEYYNEGEWLELLRQDGKFPKLKKSGELWER